MILRVRDTVVELPEDVNKAVENERQEMNSFVPMLMSVSGGLRWVPFALN